QNFIHHITKEELNMENRAGVFMNQPSGYKSFFPKKLPPEPMINMDLEMLKLLSDADRKLGRLDGITQILPNPELFVAMYVQKEAVLSSQIEGTQASLTDILDIGADMNKDTEIQDVVNYVSAMKYGLTRLQTFPLCLRLIREIHAVLLKEGRGSNRNPGEFRTSQNWIGPAGCTLSNATFVPPTVPDMNVALGDLESFFYEKDDIPSLIKIALIHAQFESIHPFLDGNGRVGRLLITFWLCSEKILSQPLLYLSYYFKINRLEYYDRLMAVRKSGDWEGWIKFFLKGIASVSDEATESAKLIIQLKEKYSQILSDKSNNNYIKLLDHLFETPFICKNSAAEFLQISYPTASTIIEEFVRQNILTDITPDQQRNKRYCFVEYVNILNRGTEL
ncbi:Fic family protein, partial [Blautia hydrogenotrophica]|uniref:Fic family protein n=2 Tax=Blautia hydrogenotrophica TaxID=53443 RepID=UPI0023F54E7C